MTRRICFITGSRADYGHLSPVMTAIKGREGLSLQLIVTGQHLDARFGETWTAIRDDGFAIDERADLKLGDDTPLETAKAVGRGVGAIGESLARLKPDIVVILGDRFEILAAAEAALLLNIPVAHIHGGEATEGAIDDAIRHAITKMSRLHFCAAEPYARRVRQMGENPKHVFTVGAPGLDVLKTMDFLSRDTLAEDLGIDLSGGLLLITYHPVTLKLDEGKAAVEELVRALGSFDDTAMVFTGVNSDPGHNVISDTISAFAGQASHRRVMINSLGQRRYLSAVREADAVIGNSSSGLIEAPALGVPTVNIGDRQKGRLRGASVIDCGDDSAEITAAISKALTPAFRSAARTSEPPYGRGGAATQIVDALAEVDLRQLSTKPFQDIMDC